MKISMLIDMLQTMQSNHGDLDVRLHDHEFMASNPVDGVTYVENKESRDSMPCDDLHNPNLKYPYVQISSGWREG